nr:hypothetical protein CFP56_32787 [Quercus suber]
MVRGTKPFPFAEQNNSLSLLSLIPPKQHAIITKISHLSLTYETVVKFHSVPVNLQSVFRIYGKLAFGGIYDDFGRIILPLSMNC